MRQTWLPTKTSKTLKFEEEVCAKLRKAFETVLRKEQLLISTMRSFNMLPSVGVFGGDSSARVTISICRSVGFTVSGVWASTREKAKHLASLMDIPFYTSRLDELLLHSDVDIVCVCGSPHQFAEVAVKALSIGKHVFCSAPAGLNLRDAEKMVSAAEYYPQLLSLMSHPLRFLKCFIQARDCIADGYCGDLLVCECTVHTENLVGSKYDWHCDQSMGGGILHSFGCHIIDILSFLVNEHVFEAQGLLQTFVKHTKSMPGFRQITSDDFCSFHLKYPSGMHANVTLNSHMPRDFYQEILIVGTKGYLKIVNGELFGERRDADGTKECLHQGESSAVKLETTDLEYCLPDMYLQGLVALIEGIKNAFQNTQSTDRRNADHNLIAAAANFEDGCYVRAVMDAIISSNSNGKWVRINALSASKEEGPFWPSSEKKQQPQQSTAKVGEVKPLSGPESAKSSPRNVKRGDKLK